MDANTMNAGRTATGSFEKWRLLTWITAILALSAGAIVLVDPGVDAARCVIRLTARTSLLLFCMAFAASAAWRLFPGAWTRWQLRNRRYLGLGFAVSHGIHAAGIAAFATLDPLLFQATNGMGSMVPGIIAYVFIVLMAATSFDRSAAWLGRRAWKILHTAGMYYLWVSFMIAFGKRIPQSAGYAIPLLLLCSVMGLRVWAVVRVRQAARRQAGAA